MSLRDFQPVYPYVLIERLPRRHMTPSNILMPDDLNKPLHEGIVLRTWRPWRKLVTLRSPSKSYPQITDRVLFQQSIRMVSELHQGDRVLFPHFAVRAEDATDGPNVVFVKETAPAIEGSIYGVIVDDETVVNRDVELLRDTVASYTPSAVARESLVAHLLDNFVLLPRFSVTTSGKSRDGVL